MFYKHITTRHKKKTSHLNRKHKNQINLNWMAATKLKKVLKGFVTVQQQQTVSIEQQLDFVDRDVSCPVRQRILTGQAFELRAENLPDGRSPLQPKAAVDSNVFKLGSMQQLLRNQD